MLVGKIDWAYLKIFFDLENRDSEVLIISQLNEINILILK